MRAGVMMETSEVWQILVTVLDIKGGNVQNKLHSRVSPFMNRLSCWAFHKVKNVLRQDTRQRPQRAMRNNPRCLKNVNIFMTGSLSATHGSRWTAVLTATEAQISRDTACAFTAAERQAALNRWTRHPERTVQVPLSPCAIITMKIPREQHNTTV